MGPRQISVKRAAKVNNQLECRTCKKKFWMTCKYIDHMSTHKHFLFSCNICNKGFSDQKQLDMHYITHKEVNTYDCNQCRRKFLQKNKLEEHMQFHFIIPPPNESSVSTKKAVHFSNILESKDISDESSFSDSDFDDGYKLPTLTKTRSGRTVKAKKLFYEEPEVKRRRKSSGEVLKKDLENVEQSLKLKTVNKTNFVTEKPLPPDSANISPKKVFNKKLVILVEKIPESVYRSCVASGNVYDLGSSSNQKLANTYVSSDSQTKLLNHGSKVVSKSFPVVTGFELSRNLNKNNTKVTNVSCDPQSSMTSNCSLRDVGTTLKKSVCKEKTVKAKTKTSSKSDVTSCKNSKNSNTVASISTPQSPVKSAQNDRFPAGNINSFLNNTSSPSKTNSNAYFYTSQVNKQFLYVGPKQDINKIKNIIEELKVMPTPNVQTSETKPAARANSSTLSQNVCNENTTNVGNLNVDTPNKESSGVTGYELESTNGILGKKVVKDFILIKITPELMEKMQRETLSAPQSHGNLESLDATTVSSACLKDLKQVSCTTEENEMSELVQNETLQSEHGNLESFNTTKSGDISSVSFSLNSQVSHVAEKNEEPELTPTLHNKTLVSSQKGNGNSKSFSAYKPPNISSMPSGLNKSSSKVSRLTDKNRKPELMKKVRKKMQRETSSASQNHGNSKSFSAYKSPNVSSIPSSLSKNSSKVSQLTDKNRKSELMKKVHRKMQRETLSASQSHRNLKTFDATTVSSVCPKDLNQVSHTTKGNEMPELVQNKTLQSGHGNLESFSKTCKQFAKPANNSSVSFNLNKNLSQVSHVTEKNEKQELMPKVHRKTSVSSQKENGNSKSFSAHKPTNILSTPSSLNKKSSKVSQLTNKNETPELMETVHMKTPESRQKGPKISQVVDKNKTPDIMQKEKRNLIFPQKRHGNLKSLSAVKTVNTSSVSPSMNKKSSKMSHTTGKQDKPELMQKVRKKSLVSPQMKFKNLKSFIVSKPTNISPVSSTENKDITEVSQLRDKSETSELVQNVRKKNRMFPQLGHGNSKSFSTVRTANTSSLSSSMNKKLSQVSDITEGNRKPELTQKLHRKTSVPLQKGHKNLKSFIVQPANISPVSSMENKDLTEVSQSKEKSGLRPKVMSETEVSPQRRHGNLEPSSLVMSANISPVSSSSNKNLTEISEPKGKNIEKNRLKQKVKSKTQVSQRRRHVNLERSSAIMPANVSPMSSSLNKNLTEISEQKGKNTEKNILIQNRRSGAPVSLQKKHGKLEPSITVMSAVSPVSSSLNNDLTEISHSAEKNILIQNIKSKAQVSLQKGHGNLEPSSIVMPGNISPVSSSLNKDLTEGSQLTEESGLMQRIKNETQVSQQVGHENLEPCIAVLSTDISPVSSTLNRNLNEVSQSTEINGIPKLVEKIKRKTPQREHGNLEPFNAPKPANVSPLSSSLNKGLTVVSHMTAKNKIKGVLKSPEAVLKSDSKTVDKSLKSQAVNCMNSDTLTICQGTSNDTLSKTAKVPEQDIKFSISIDKKCAETASSQSEHCSSSREEKLLARYKAKIEEKERKKREKYELKKRMRYVEKIHGRNIPNLTELMLLFREVYNESFSLARNLEGNAESCLQSKTKSFTTETVPDVESEEYISVVSD